MEDDCLASKGEGLRDGQRSVGMAVVLAERRGVACQALVAHWEVEPSSLRPSWVSSVERCWRDVVRQVDLAWAVEPTALCPASRAAATLLLLLMLASAGDQLDVAVDEEWHLPVLDSSS